MNIRFLNSRGTRKGQEFLCRERFFPYRRVVKGIFVICEWPNFFPVKCEMASFFSYES